MNVAIFTLAFVWQGSVCTAAIQCPECGLVDFSGLKGSTDCAVKAAVGSILARSFGVVRRNDTSCNQIHIQVKSKRNRGVVIENHLLSVLTKQKKILKTIGIEFLSFAKSPTSETEKLEKEISGLETDRLDLEES